MLFDDYSPDFNIVQLFDSCYFPIVDFSFDKISMMSIGEILVHAGWRNAMKYNNYCAGAGQ